MAATLTTKQMELEGTLKAFQLSDIMRFLAMGKMSGVLTFIGKDRTIELTIRDGAIIGTFSGDRFPGLGQMLVYNGLITRRQLEEMLDLQRDADASKMLGEILIEKGLATQEQIESALTLQIREDLWDLFTWSDGTFKFEHGLRPGLQRSLVTLEIEPLVEEGFQHLEQWRVIAGNLSDPNLVFRVSSEMPVPFQARLTPNTWRVLSLINGRHSIQVLIYLSGIGRFETLCALDRLVTLQMIEPVSTRFSAYAPGRLGEASSAAVAAPGPHLVAPSEAVTESDADDEEGGRRRFFGLRRRAPRKDSPAEPPSNPVEGLKTSSAKAGAFDTSVALACAMVNRLAARLCSEPDFYNPGGGSALLESLWKEIGMRFPRADLIVLREGLLDPEPFEAYVRVAGGVSEYLAGCYEDGMEVLAQLGDRLARLARERLGDRARKLILETIRPYLDCTEMKYGTDFMPRQWVEPWLEPHE